jgi:hypothetical protein
MKSGSVRVRLPIPRSKFTSFVIRESRKERKTMPEKPHGVHWLTKVSEDKQALLRAVAGDPFEVKATDLLPYEGGRPAVWRMAGKIVQASVLKWTPRSPGVYRMQLRVGRYLVQRMVTVGLRPADLVKRPQDFDSYFCFIVPNAHKVHFFPLLANTGDVRKGRDKLKVEIEEHHPAFARFIGAHTRIYRDRVLSHPFVDPKSFRPGLYAVCANDLCYLGSDRRLNAIAGRLQKLLRTIAARKTGRGHVLEVIEKTMAEIRPTDYKYSADVQFPVNSLKRQGAFAPERFSCGVISSVVAATMNFARGVGSVSGRPGEGLTTCITFNSANGSMSTSLFNSAMGLSRQVMSAFETGHGIGALADLAGLGGFGIGGHSDSRWGDVGTDLGNFGRGGAGLGSLFGDGPVSGTTGGRGMGVSSFARLGGQQAMNTEGGSVSPGDIPGYHEGAHYWVKGSDGSTVGFGYGADGSPAESAVDNVNGQTVFYGDVTVWDSYEDEPITAGAEPTPEGEPTPVPEPEPEPTPTEPTPEPSSEPSPEPEENPEPPGTDPAEMPAPDDGSGTGGGGGPVNGGGGPTFGTSRDGQRLALWVLTRAGGYTDPGPEDNGAGLGGGGVIIPGGGIVDPVDPDSPDGPIGGFGTFGGIIRQ